MATRFIDTQTPDWNEIVMICTPWTGAVTTAKMLASNNNFDHLDHFTFFAERYAYNVSQFCNPLVMFVFN